MNGKMLGQAGALLFGHYWRAPFEERFAVNNRTLRRMLKGEQDVPNGLALELETALRDHANAVDGILEAIAV